ncbi:MAG: hypothetical protein ABIR91_01315, partial [Candidatus Saccharimonadales bacterium]
PDAGTIVESVTLTLRSDDAASFHSSIWMSEYAETGYEGHHRRHLNDCSDDDIATYGDLIAMIVGDQPESESMKTVRTLDETIDSIATEQARSAVRHLIVSSWPAQALYILSLQVPDGGTILENLHDEARVQKGIDAIDTVLAAMQKRAR